MLVDGPLRASERPSDASRTLSSLHHGSKPSHVDRLCRLGEGDIEPALPEMEDEAGREGLVEDGGEASSEGDATGDGEAGSAIGPEYAVGVMLP